MHEFGPTHLHLWGTSGHLRGAVGLPSTSPRAAQALRWRRMTTASRASGRVATRVSAALDDERRWPRDARRDPSSGGTAAPRKAKQRGNRRSAKTRTARAAARIDG